jgi:ABC-2 type transport system permease protein/oleandomycin transport system permease protein
MTASTVRAAIPDLDRRRVPWPVADALAVARRNLISMTRAPQVIVFTLIQPVLLILIFRYVFAGSMHIPGVHYVDYLISGILVLTVAFATQTTATAVAEDLHRGLIERFRSLAMSRSALLAGRALADSCRFLFMILLMIGVGYIVGFRLRTTPLALAGAVALLLVFGFAMSWVMALVALTSKSAEAATAASFPVLALLCFPSNVFVATSLMPAAVRAYAAHQPVSANVSAVRSLLLGGPTGWHVLVALFWCLGMLAVFAPLAVQRYRRSD